MRVCLIQYQLLAKHSVKLAFTHNSLQIKLHFLWSADFPLFHFYLREAPHLYLSISLRLSLPPYLFLTLPFSMNKCKKKNKSKHKRHTYIYIKHIIHYYTYSIVYLRTQIHQTHEVCEKKKSFVHLTLNSDENELMNDERKRETINLKWFQSVTIKVFWKEQISLINTIHTHIYIHTRNQ